MSTLMLRMYAEVEMPVIVVSGYGDVSVSSPTCVCEKSPGATWVELLGRYGRLFVPSGAVQYAWAPSCEMTASTDASLRTPTATNRGSDRMPAPAASGESFIASVGDMAFACAYCVLNPATSTRRNAL